jgi:hypothetical protein
MSGKAGLSDGLKRWSWACESTSRRRLVPPATSTPPSTLVGLCAARACRYSGRSRSLRAPWRRFAFAANATRDLSRRLSRRTTGSP